MVPWLSPLPQKAPCIKELGDRQGAQLQGDCELSDPVIGWPEEQQAGHSFLPLTSKTHTECMTPTSHPQFSPQEGEERGLKVSRSSN